LRRRGNAVLEKTQSPQAQRFNAYDRPHDDLREFIARAERAGANTLPCEW